MNYKEIESRFDSEATIDTLLMDYEDKFNMIEDDGQKLSRGAFCPADIEEVLKRQTGIYMVLNIVTEIADAMKKKEEGILNYEKVQACQKDEKKVVQAQIDKQVSHDVQHIRRVRNLFAAYRNSSDKCILSCQSILKKALRNINTGGE